MKMSIEERISLTIGALALVAILFLLFSSAVYAGGGDDHHTSDTDVDVEVGGVTATTEIGGDIIDMRGGDTNVSTGGNRSLALGNVLGDVDIAGCLGSTQWSTPVYGKQKLTLNWVCVAEFYIRYQQPELAAMALCNTEILKEFDTEEECEQAHKFLAQAVVTTVSESEDEDEGEFHEEQRTVNMMLQSEIEQLREMYERRPTPKPVQKTVIEQRPLLSAEQRAKLQELKK